MDRWWDDDEEPPTEPAPRRRLRRGVRRQDAEADLTWEVDPDRFLSEVEGEQEARPDFGDRSDIDEVVLPFEDRYDPDELAAIEDFKAREAEHPVTGVSGWRKRSAIGAVLTGMALGLREVFEPEDERSIVIEVDADGEPLDLPVDLFLDPDSPAGSLCIVHRDAGVRPPSV